MQMAGNTLESRVKKKIANTYLLYDHSDNWLFDEEIPQMTNLNCCISHFGWYLQQSYTYLRVWPWTFDQPAVQLQVLQRRPIAGLHSVHFTAGACRETIFSKKISDRYFEDTSFRAMRWTMKDVWSNHRTVLATVCLSKARASIGRRVVAKWSTPVQTINWSSLVWTIKNRRVGAEMTHIVAQFWGGKNDVELTKRASCNTLSYKIIKEHRMNECLSTIRQVCCKHRKITVE
jgi:hypothetical protein